MNSVLDAVLQDLAMDGDVGTPLPDGLQAALRRYHRSSTLSEDRRPDAIQKTEEGEGSSTTPEQRVDITYCSYVWRLLCRRTNISLAVWQDAGDRESKSRPKHQEAATSKATVEVGEDEDDRMSMADADEVKATGTSKAKAKAKHKPRSSIKVDATVPGTENLTLIPNDGDGPGAGWRNKSLLQLLDSFSRQQLRVICPQDVIRSAIAPGRVADLAQPILWSCLQVIARGRAEGVSGAQLMAELGIAGSASFYLLKNLINLNLVTKFTARETRFNTVTVVHNKFLNDSVLYQNRVRAATAVTSYSSKDEAEPEVDRDGAGPGRSRQMPSARTILDLPSTDQATEDDSNQPNRLSEQDTEALAQFDLEPEPTIRVQALNFRYAYAPGNQVLQHSRDNVHISEDQGPSEALSVQDATEDGEQLEDADPALDEPHQRSGATREERVSHVAEGDLNGASDPYEREVSYLSYSRLPPGAINAILTYRQEELALRFLKLLRQAPMNSIYRPFLRQRAGVVGIDSLPVRKAFNSLINKMWQLWHYIEPIKFSIRIQRPTSNAADDGDAGSEAMQAGHAATSSGDLVDVATMTYLSWKLTDRGRKLLEEKERRRWPLEDELKRQLASVKQSGIFREVPFERQVAEAIRAAGRDGMVKADLLDLLTAERTVSRSFERISYFQESDEPVPILDMALVPLMDRTAEGTEILRLFTCQTLLQRSAHERTNLWAGPRTIKPEDVDSRDGTVPRVGVGGWLALSDEQRWGPTNGARGRWSELGLDNFGVGRPGMKRRIRSDDSEADDPTPSTSKARGRPSKTKAPKKLKYPERSAARFARLEAERKAAREARRAEREALLPGNVPSPSIEEASATTSRAGDVVGSQSPSSVPYPSERHPSQESVALEAAALLATVEAGPLETSQTAPMLASAGNASPTSIPPPPAMIPTATMATGSEASGTIREAQETARGAGNSASPGFRHGLVANDDQPQAGPSLPRSTKRVRIEEDTTLKLNAKSGDTDGPGEGQGSGSAGAPRSLQVDAASSKTSRLSLFELRQEAAAIDFLREHCGGVIREDRLRNVYTQQLGTSVETDTIELRSVAQHPKVRNELLRKSEQIARLHVSVEDPDTKRPRQVAIIYIKSLSPSELQAGIQEIQQGGYKRSLARSSGNPSKENEPSVQERRPYSAHEYVVIDRSGTTASGPPRARKSRLAKKRHTKVLSEAAMRRAEARARRELARQARHAKAARKQHWQALLERMCNDHHLTEHQRKWVESSVSAAYYRYIAQLKSARFLNIDQLFKKRIEHALSTPEDQLYIAPKQKRPRASEGAGKGDRSSASPKRTTRRRDRNKSGSLVTRPGATTSQAQHSSSFNYLHSDGADIVGISRRQRHREPNQFETDELTRDVGTILSCRDRERVGGRSNWSAVRQLGIENINRFKQRWHHLKSYPAEDRYLRTLETTWMELWRTHRGTERLPDHDPDHPTDFNLRLHLEFLRRHIDKNKVTSLATIKAPSEVIDSAAPLDEWIDEVGAPVFEGDELYVNESVCIVGNRLKSWLAWASTLDTGPGRHQKGSPASSKGGSQRELGLALTIAKVLLHSRDEDHSAQIVPFLAQAAGREPIGSALQVMLDAGTIRAAHSEGRMLPVLNFEFTPEYHSALDGLGPKMPASDFIKHAHKLADEVQKQEMLEVNALVEGEEAGVLLQLISTGKVELGVNLAEVKMLADLQPITDTNARDMTDQDVTSTMVAAVLGDASAASAVPLSGNVRVCWDELEPRWATWLGQPEEAVEDEKRTLLGDAVGERRGLLERLLDIVETGGPDGLPVAEVLKQMSSRRADDAVRAVLGQVVGGARPVCFLAGYDVTRLVSARFARHWALPRPKVGPSDGGPAAGTSGGQSSSEAVEGVAVVRPDGWFVPRAWSTALGEVDCDRRRACVDAVLTECKYRPGTTLAKLVHRFERAMSRLDVVDIVGFLVQGGLLETRCGVGEDGMAMGWGGRDAELSLIPCNRLWWEDDGQEGSADGAGHVPASV